MSDFDKVASYIDAHTEEIISLTSRLVSIPSTKSAPEPGMPYGRNVAAVLDEGERISSELGLLPMPFEGRCIAADLNDRETALAILCHLDVVPVEGESRHPPFTVFRDEEFLWGRGVSDNKGPSAAVLMAAHAVKACGIPLKYNVRVLLGGDEECGGSDMIAYRKKIGFPPFVFVPDAGFPVGISERGMIRYSCEVPVSDTAVRSLRAGVKANVIPGEATAELIGIPAETVRTAAQSCVLPATVDEKPDCVSVTVHGVSGHSSFPGGFKNALTALIGILTLIEPDCALWQALNSAFPYGVTDGRALLGFGDKCTLSLTVFRMSEGTARFEGDSRVFIDASAAAIAETMQHNFPYPLTFLCVQEPHSVPADSPFVKLLQAVYKDNTGRDDPPYHMGARTYAYCDPNAVIFGSGLNGDRHGGAHSANESVNISTLVTASKIFADAIIRICGTDSDFVDEAMGK